MSTLKLDVTRDLDGAETSSSSTCRAHLAVDTLRAKKWTAGSWAVITRTDGIDGSGDTTKVSRIVVPRSTQQNIPSIPH
jgi:hypothetical protein